MTRPDWAGPPRHRRTGGVWPAAAAGVPANILLRSKYRKSMFIHKGVLPANQVCMNLIQPFTGVD